jgi:predicted RecA/RadA family phage recombinase
VARRETGLLAELVHADMSACVIPALQSGDPVLVGSLLGIARRVAKDRKEAERRG